MENTIQQTPKVKSSLIIGFASFGLLLGYITGLTSSEIAQTIITALFAFLGGKLFSDLNENPSKANSYTGKILLGFSFLFFIGLNLGILVKINQWLTIKPKTTVAQTISKSEEKHDNPYLRSIIVSRNLETKFRNQELSAEEKDSLINILFLQNK